MSAAESILEKFKSGAFDYQKAGDICRLLGTCSRSDREAVSRILKGLEEAGEIVQDERGRYVSPGRLGLVRGTVQGNERGFAFLLTEEGDLFLPRRALHGALHGDIVFAKRTGGERGDEAAVYSIVRRGMKELTGTYYRDKRGGLVEPDERRFCESVRVVGGVRAAAGEKVLVRILSYPDGKYPEGEILAVLGKSGDLLTEEEAIVRSQQLPEEFPQKVLAGAKRAASLPVTSEGRTDFREETIITIDGDDSRDFDDAVTVRREGDGFLLGVHIADVSHYVARGSALDAEAYSRGTSVYFPDRVIPMLPEALSDDVCSLRQGEDRLTLSCLMAIDREGKVTESRVERGIIRSRARMTYAKVAAILEGAEALCAEYAHLLPLLEDMRALAEILIQRRASRGGVDLDVREAHIGFDGVQVSLAPAERTIAHRMIEEFMILANETVASFMSAYEMPMLFRVHEKPTEERAENFRAYLRGLGLRADFRPANVRPGEYGKILSSLKEDKLRAVVNRVMLRSMAKARYSAENCGHFGLASACYCHFTSPIRRYPDLIVHRVVKTVLDGRAGEAEREYGKFVREAAGQCSARERRAEEAERAVDDLYKVWYMRGHLGEEYTGTVSGVAPFGIFVELENTAEGLIKVENLPGEGYEFIEEKLRLRGTSRAFCLGDTVRIVVAGCDIGARRCEFVLAEAEN